MIEELLTLLLIIAAMLAYVFYELKNQIDENHKLSLSLLDLTMKHARLIGKYEAAIKEEDCG